MKNKLFYTQPTTDLLELRSERGILTGSPDGTWENSIMGGAILGWGDDSNDYGLE